jgi:hypothetical protein
MNYNIKRHKLLEILTEQNLNVQLDKPGFQILGISYDEIYKKLNITDFQLLELTSELYDNKEIGYHNAYEVEGLYAKNKGIAAYSNKKYLKLYKKSIVENVKDVIQIAIPVLSVIVAIVALTIKIETVNNQNEKRFNDIEKKVNLNNIKTMNIRAKTESKFGIKK